MLGAYIDIQNILNSKYKEQDVYIKTGKIINPEAPIYEQRYELRPIERLTGTLLPKYRSDDRVIDFRRNRFFLF